MKKFFAVLTLLFIVSACQANVSTASGYYENGNKYLANRDYSLALEQYKYAINTDKTNADYYLAAAAILELKGNYAEAIDLLKNGLEFVADPNVFRIEIGNLYLQNQDYVRSLENYNQVLKNDPNNTFAQIGKIKVLSVTNNQSELTALLDTISVESKNQELLLVSGALKYKDLKKSRQLLKAAIALGDNTLADNAREIRKSVNAIAANASPLFNKANIVFYLVNANEQEAAFTISTELISENEFYETAFLYHGVIENYLRMYEKASEHLEKAILINPQLTTAYLHLVAASYSLNNSDKAISSATSFYNTYKNLGFPAEQKAELEQILDLLLDYGNYATALSLVNDYQASNEHGGDVNILLVKLKSLVFDNKYRKAEAHGEELFTRESELTPDNQAEFYAFYGYTLYKRGDKSKGIDNIKKSQSLNKFLPVSYEFEGLILIDQGNTVDGKKLLEKSLDIDLNENKRVLAILNNL